MKGMIPCLIASLALMMPYSFADVRDKKIMKFLEIELAGIKIKTEYLTKYTAVTYHRTDDKMTAEIKEKDSGIILGSYSGASSLTKSDVQTDKTYEIAGETIHETDVIIEGTKNLVPRSTIFTAYVWANVRITSGSYWRQVDTLLPSATLPRVQAIR